MMSKVLVVDDEPDILLMIRLTLETAGHDVVLAADGEQALQRMAEDEPEVVLLDVMMPVLDGWGVLRRLQKDPDPPPVIVVSARWGPTDVRRAVDLGAVDYIAKPFQSAELLERVDDALERTPAQVAEHHAKLLEEAENAGP